MLRGKRLQVRSATHDSTGVSPCEMMLGRKVSLPIDLVLGRVDSLQGEIFSQEAHAGVALWFCLAVPRMQGAV